ncbi:MAG TPA: acyl-CoA dehydrogenase family protein [Chitinophagales bacterium]|nr:acyl-CoA dehydrogenase family protein [Chitinophagales bacterium]
MTKNTPYSDFTQVIPQLDNQFTDDTFLQDYLKRYLPADALNKISPDLHNFGKRVAKEFLEWAWDAEQNNPELTQYDAWGNRIDEIKVSQGWLNLERVAAEEGLVAIGYEREFGEHSRLYQFVKLYLYTPSSAIYSCPLAMTDGGAKLIEVYGDEYLKGEIFKGLTSRDPKQFKTSGQWMTERTGGSDVSRSMTIGEKQESGEYILRGHKWFTSAITANSAFTLASTEQPENGQRAPLSLFFLPIRNEDGSLNGIEVEALKDKLGTRALPTAQLRLTGARAHLVSEKGKGVRSIATLFNVTRIYNAVSAVSYMRRAYALSKTFSTTREAFGKKIDQHVLHKKTLRDMEIAYQSNTILAFFLTQLLGKEECNKATENEKLLLRFLTPVAKLFTAKESIKYASEHIEVFGGVGYLEDSQVPVMLRNVQTLSIWEGTTNVLSLDMLRAAEKENGFEVFQAFVKQQLNDCTASELSAQKELIQQKLNVLFNFMQQIKNKEELVAASRDIAFYIAEATIALLWLDFLKQNPENKNYQQALTYWAKYKMNEASLDAAKVLGLV